MTRTKEKSSRKRGKQVDLPPELHRLAGMIAAATDEKLAEVFVRVCGPALKAEAKRVAKEV